MARHRIPLAIAAAVLADGRSRPGRAIPPTEKAPPTTHCRVIDFESAQVHTSPTVPTQRVLVVHGEKPYLNMQANLVALVYIRQPEYWGIEVTGCLPEVGLPAVTSYVAKFDLEGTIGTRGIDVIGASRSEKIDIPVARHR